MLYVQNDLIRLHLEQDTCSESPRDWDNLGTFVGWHGRYEIGDEQPSEEPRQWLHEWRRGRKTKDYVLLAVYMIDHGNVGYSTTPFGCPWDSGQVGWIYATREDATAAGFDMDTDRERIEQCLAAEIETYSQWANGDIWSFAVERRQPCGHWEIEDSCGGFYGTDPTKNGMVDHMPDDAVALLAQGVG